VKVIKWFKNVNAIAKDGYEITNEISGKPNVNNIQVLDVKTFLQHLVHKQTPKYSSINSVGDYFICPVI